MEKNEKLRAIQLQVENRKNKKGWKKIRFQEHLLLINMK
jgi:hypothetical protein